MKFLLSLFMWSLMVTVAFAADAEPTALGLAVAGFFNQVVFPLLGSLVMVLFAMALTAFRKKTGINLSADTEAYLESLAKQGIGKAEEHAADYLKRRVTKLTSNEKFDIAVAHVLTTATIPVSREKADALIKSVIGKTPGVGAS